MSYLRAGFFGSPRPTSSTFNLSDFFFHPAPFFIIYFAPPHFCPPKIARRRRHFRKICQIYPKSMENLPVGPSLFGSLEINLKISKQSCILWALCPQIFKVLPNVRLRRGIFGGQKWGGAKYIIKNGPGQTTTKKNAATARAIESRIGISVKNYP